MSALYAIYQRFLMYEFSDEVGEVMAKILRSGSVAMLII